MIEFIDENQNLHLNWEGYMNLGPPTCLCTECGAIMWFFERNNKSGKRNKPTFTLCCMNGQVVLLKEKMLMNHYFFF